MAEKIRAATVMIRRHTLVTRLTHWLNVLVISLLLMSGLQIFNAHPALYWGEKSTFADPWLSMTRQDVADVPRGLTTVGDLQFDTTGLFGWSGKPGMGEARGFPAWATVPSYRSLTDGRRWHFFMAWLFVINGLAYWLWGLIGGHVRRDRRGDDARRGRSRRRGMVAGRADRRERENVRAHDARSLISQTNPTHEHESRTYR